MAIDKTTLITNIKGALQPLLRIEYENPPSVTIIHAQIDSPENTQGGAMSSPAPSPNAVADVKYFTVGNTLEQTISGASGIIIDIEGDDIDSVNRYRRSIVDIPGRYLFSDTGGKFSGDALTVLDGGRVVIRDIGSTIVERTLTHANWRSLTSPFLELSFTLGETITQASTAASGVVVASTTDDTIFKDLLTGTWDISNNVTGGTSGRTLTASTLSIVSGAWDITEDIIEKNASKTEIITTLSAAKIHSLTLNPRGILEASTTMAQAIATPVTNKVIDHLSDQSENVVASADYTIASRTFKRDTSGDYNLITTGADTINVTLPSALANSGRVLKFIKADSGTGKISIDRLQTGTTGTTSEGLLIIEENDTLGINGDSILTHPSVDGSAVGETISQDTTNASGVVRSGSITGKTLFKDLNTGTWGTATDVVAVRTLTHANHDGSAFTVNETITQVASGTDPTGIVVSSTVDVTTFRDLGTATWNATDNVTGASVTLTAANLSAVSAAGVTVAAADLDAVSIGVTSMELWYQGNYVNLMSDGIDRWHVVGTEMFIIPTDRRLTSWEPSAGAATSFTPVNYATADRVPVGTSEINLFGIVRWVGNNTLDQGMVHIRKTGETATNDSVVRHGSFQYESLAAGVTVDETFFHNVQIDSARTFEYTWLSGYATGTFYTQPRGYRLG